jgi:hypothetical protein
VATANRHIFAALGAATSIAFIDVTPEGVDRYHVKFQNGEGHIDISMDEGGKIQCALYRQE